MFVSTPVRYSVFSSGHMRKYTLLLRLTRSWVKITANENRLSGGMSVITIRAWEDRFAADYIRLSVEWLEKYVRVEPADEAILYHPHEAVLDDGGMIFFACDGDTPVGTVSVIRMADGCFELAKLAVTEAYKGQGISKLLMDAALNFGREKMCEKVILFTNRKLKPAIGLYEHYGFREVPMVDNEYEESDMRMELQLAERKIN